jgi:hypothetical protein
VLASPPGAVRRTRGDLHGRGVLKRSLGLLLVLNRSQVHREEGVITPESLMEFLQTAWKHEET